MGNHKISSAIWNRHEAQLPLCYIQPFWNRRIQSVPLFIWPRFAEKRGKNKFLHLILYPKQTEGLFTWARLTRLARFLFYVRPKRLWISLYGVVCWKAWHLFIFCLRLFLSHPIGPLSLSDLLAALYNLCFFIQSSVSSDLLNQGRLQRLDEVLMGIFLSNVDLI